MCKNKLKMNGHSVFMLLCNYNEFNLPMIIDTGAEMSLMPLSVVQKLGIDYLINKNYRGEIKGAGNSNSSIIGMIQNLSFKIRDLITNSNINVVTDFAIADIHIDHAILGLNFMDYYDSNISIRGKTVTINNVPIKFLDNYQKIEFKDVINLHVHNNNIGNDIYIKIYKIVGNIINDPDNIKYHSINYKAVQNYQCLHILESIGFNLDHKTQKVFINNPNIQLFEKIHQHINLKLKHIL